MFAFRFLKATMPEHQQHVLVRALLLLHQGDYYKMVINESIELGYYNDKYYYIDGLVVVSDIEGQEILPYLYLLSCMDIYSLILVQQNDLSSRWQLHTEYLPTPVPLEQYQEYTFCI